MCGTREKRKKREWVICLHNHSLSVVCSRAGMEAPTCSNELSVKWLPSQDMAHTDGM